MNGLVVVGVVAVLGVVVHVVSWLGDPWAQHHRRLRREHERELGVDRRVGVVRFGLVAAAALIGALVVLAGPLVTVVFAGLVGAWTVVGARRVQVGRRVPDVFPAWWGRGR